MSDMDKAIATCITYFAYRPGIRRRLAALVGEGMRAQSLEQDRATGSATSVFCWFHGDEVGHCHKMGRCAVHRLACQCKPRLPCQGEPVHSATDVAGESGVGFDHFRRLLADVDRAEQLLAHAVGDRIPATYPEIVEALSVDPPSVTRKAANAFSKAIAATRAPGEPPVGLAADGAPGCQSCARLKVDGVPLWSNPDYAKGEPTDLGGALKRKIRCCRACMRFAVNQDPTRLPSVAELQHRHDDPRGHWPTRHGNGKAA